MTENERRPRVIVRNLLVAAAVSAALMVFVGATIELLGRVFMSWRLADTLAPIFLFPGWLFAMPIAASAGEWVKDRGDFLLLALAVQYLVLVGLVYWFVHRCGRSMVATLRSHLSPRVKLAVLAVALGALTMGAAGMAGVRTVWLQPAWWLINMVAEVAGSSLGGTPTATVATWLLEWSIVAGAAYVILRRAANR